MEDPSLKDKILATFAYFDVFDYPLTRAELYRYLMGEKHEPTAVFADLDELVGQGKLGVENGYYYLAGRSDAPQIRARRYFISGQKWRRVNRAAKVLRRLPFIRAVFICNRLSYNNADLSSDIDLFIVSHANRIFAARFFVTLVFSLLRWRRHGRLVKDRFCLSFYIDERHQNLVDILLPDADWHFLYWLYQFVPIIGTEGFYQKFLVDNLWMQKVLGAYGVMPADWAITKNLVRESRIKKFIEGVLGGGLGDGLERSLASLQLAKIHRSSQRLGKDASIIANHEVLKFHPHDKRILYREFFYDRLKQIGLSPEAFKAAFPGFKES